MTYNIFDRCLTSPAQPVWGYLQLLDQASLLAANWALPPLALALIRHHTENQLHVLYPSNDLKCFSYVHCTTFDINTWSVWGLLTVSYQLLHQPLLHALVPFPPLITTFPRTYSHYKPVTFFHTGGVPPVEKKTLRFVRKVICGSDLWGKWFVREVNGNFVWPELRHTSQFRTQCIPIGYVTIVTETWNFILQLNLEANIMIVFANWTYTCKLNLRFHFAYIHHSTVSAQHSKTCRTAISQYDWPPIQG